MGPLSPPIARSWAWGPQAGVPETTVESLVNNCLFDSDKGAQVWKKRRTVAPDPGENYWIELTLKKDEEITDLKMELEEVRREFRQLENMKCLQAEKWRKEAMTLSLELKLKNAEMETMRSSGTEDWRKKAMTLASELKVRRRLMQAGVVLMEEAHKLEFDGFRLKAPRVLELLKGSFENQQTASGEAEARDTQLAMVLPRQEMRPEESTNLEGCEQNEALDLLMNPQSKKRREYLEAVEQYYDVKFKRREILEPWSNIMMSSSKQRGLEKVVKPGIERHSGPAENRNVLKSRRTIP